MAQIDNPRSVNKALAHMVKPVTHDHALRIGVKAEGLLASHHKTGQHRIEVAEGRRSDAFVSLVGPSALSVEVGHFAGYKGDRRFVEGLHVLKRAAGLPT